MPLTSAISVTTISSSMRVTPDSLDRAQRTACCALRSCHRAQRTACCALEACHRDPRGTCRAGRRRLLVAPANNVCVVPLSARLPVGSERNNVGLVSVIAGEFVEIRMAPNICGSILRQIRAGPLIDTVRLHAQRVQSHLGGGEIAG